MVFGRVRGLGAIVIAGGLLVAAPLWAAPPKVNYLFPAGGQVGQTVTVTAAGEFSNWPNVKVWADRPGVSATPEKDKGKFKVAIAADAEPGVAWLRVYDDEGAAVLRPFVVGTLPEIEETEPNDLPIQCKPIAPGVVVNGKLRKSGDHDGVAVTLKQGQTLVASLLGNSILGSPMDSVLQICNLVERKPVVGTTPRLEAYVVAQDHDANGLDPQIVFQAPRDGNYLVRAFAFPSDPNSSIAYSGSDSYIYRLTLTTGPFVYGALPLAASVEQPTDVKLLGWNIPADAAQSIPAAASSKLPAPLSSLWASAWLPGAAESVSLSRQAIPSTVEVEPSDEKQPQAITLPTIVSGQLPADGDADVFSFPATKGKKISFTLEARELGYPIDGLLLVTDEAGKTLAENDDANRKPDPQIVFTPPADGTYRVVVRDLNVHGGPRFLYRLQATPLTPDYAINVATDSFVVTAGKTVEIPLTIDRRNGFAGAIKILAHGLPEGISAEEITSEPKGDSAKAVKLVLKAAEGAMLPVSGPFHIEGQSGDDAATRRYAGANLNLPLAGEHYLLWATGRK